MLVVNCCFLTGVKEDTPIRGFLAGDTANSGERKIKYLLYQKYTFLSLIKNYMYIITLKYRGEISAPLPYQSITSNTIHKI